MSTFLLSYQFLISIHALREEGDYTTNTPHGQEVLFLSTPSARRATHINSGYRTPTRFLSTPSARRATFLFSFFSPCRAISIHALREEGDTSCLPYAQRGPISIHALREEGDPQDYTGFKLAVFISIHALREEGDI